ncbi:MAG TPA: NADPH-dependent F420 reductase [Dehalococcoidia bacterium]|nr:NADPH-dependent F420 reductase [Dehalococcoidia bacterium]
MTTIGFIGGTGEEGMGLAFRFAKAGHPCVIGSRSAEKAAGAVAELRAQDAGLPLTAATNADAAAAGEIVVVTTPYAAQSDTLPPLAGALAGKLVVSTVVPMAFAGGRASLLPVPEGSAAQQEQALLPQSIVVAAFQNLSARKLLKGAPIEADVVVCADDAGSKQRVMALAAAIDGVRGIDGGPLANAQLVEGITVLLVAVNRAYKTQAGIRIAGVA